MVAQLFLSLFFAFYASVQNARADVRGFAVIAQRQHVPQGHAVTARRHVPELHVVAQPLSLTAGEAELVTVNRPVPLMGQGTLGGSAACLPTAMSMVMAYWHRQDSRFQNPSRETLLSVAQQRYNFIYGRGMRLYDGEALVAEFGYAGEVRFLQGPDAQQQLRALVENQPVIVNVQVNLGIANPYQAHAMIVVGLSADGQRVRLNDPWYSGRTLDVPWAQFAASWASFPNVVDNAILLLTPLQPSEPMAPRQRGTLWVW